MLARASVRVRSFDRSSELVCCASLRGGENDGHPFGSTEGCGVRKRVLLQRGVYCALEFSLATIVQVGALINHPNGHIIVYHLLIEGRVFAQVEHDRVALNPGDIVIFPHGDSHRLESGPAPRTVDGESELQRIFSGGLKVSCQGGGGEVSRFVCGFIV